LAADRIPLASPDITDAEVDAVCAVLRTRFLSQGPRLLEFENGLASYVGTQRAKAVSSGTAGLHLAVRALGLGPGDEVVTTPFSFVASANALLYEGVRPVFADVDPVGLNLDPERVAAALTPRTRAVLVVHVFGRPAPIERLVPICRARGLALIEDACEALGAVSGGQRLGSIGDVGVFAFYPNKQMTTGEGGAVVTNDVTLAERIAALRNHGRIPGQDVHSALGYNYRLSELACALGLAQLGRLPELLARRAELARLYDERLRGHPGLILPELEVAHGSVSWFVYVVRLSDPYGERDRDAVMAELRAAGIGCGRYFAPIHLQPHFRERFGYRGGEFPVAEQAGGRTLALPFHTRLSPAEMDEVCERLTAAIRRRSRTAGV